MLRSEKEFRNSRNQEDSQYILILEDFQRDIGVLHRLEAVHDESQKNQANRQYPSERRREEPHEPVAIDQNITDHEHQERDEESRSNINTLEGHPLRHRTPGPAEGNLDQYHETHRPYREDMHHLPGEMESDDRCQPCTAGDSGEKDDMQYREEDSEIALGRHPKLDIRHTFKSALNLSYSGDETDRQKNRHVSSGHGDEVTDSYQDSRGDEQLLVGKAELCQEEHGEPDRHAREPGIKQHEKVLQLESRSASDSFQGTEIDTSGELDTEDLQNIYPRLYAFGHPIPEHRHQERRCRSIGNWRFEIENLSHKRNPLII